MGDGVFTNTVVWRKLGNYLSFGDLKDLRLVSRSFNQKVLEDTNFKTRALVHLTKDRILKSNEFCTTAVQWKNIKIDLLSSVELQEENQWNEESSGEENINWIYPKLQSADQLVLCGKNSMFANAPISFDYPSIRKILEAPDNLSRLDIDVNILNEPGNAVSFANLSEKVCRTLEKLAEFHIFSPHYGSLEPGRPSDFTDSLAWIGPEMKNIHVINIGRLITEDNTNNEIDYELFLRVQNLLGIIEDNKNKITKLLLDDPILWSMTDDDESLHSVAKTTFPSLKFVGIRVMNSASDLKNLKEFLTKQPKLEGIDLTYLNQLPKELISIIRDKNSTNLKRLRIKTKGIVEKQYNEGEEEEEEAAAANIVGPTQENDDDVWSFLNKLKYLEDFQFDILLTREDLSTVQSYKKIFMNLPSSIKRISLNGFPYIDHGFLTSHDFSNLNPAIITQLILKKCPEAVNDESMEYICRNLKMLQVLYISKSSHVTDYGFTGIPIGSEVQISDFSLKNLKGMKSLTIRRCRGVTDRTCFHALTFLELNYLDVSHNDGITQTGIMQVLSSNPSLEHLKTTEFEDFPPEEELIASFPRLRIHTFSDGAESDNSDDSDIGDSSVSGGGKRYGDFDDDFEDDFGDNDYDDDFDDDYDDDCEGDF